MTYSIDRNIFTLINRATPEVLYSTPGGGHFTYTANPRCIPVKSLGVL
jgi:hypothetical protein